MRKVKAIEKSNKQRLLKVNPKLNEDSGIYFLTREDEDGFKYAYIGQAKHILSRLAQHLTGYQHIDLSIKKHGFYSPKSVFGWKVNFLNYPLDQLDAMEQQYIKKYALSGYQMRNKTSGSQGEGKRKIDDYKPTKGYREGVAHGRRSASKEVAGLFDKYLDVVIKKPCRYADMALEKFKCFLEEYKQELESGE